MAFPGRDPLSLPRALDGSRFVFVFLMEQMTSLLLARLLHCSLGSCQTQQNTFLSLGL